MPKASSVVIGERPEREITMLAEALVRHGVKTAAFVADTTEDETAGRLAEGSHGLALLPTVRCDVPLTEASKPRFPINAWLSSGAQGRLVSGPASCARDVLRDVARVNHFSIVEIWDSQKNYDAHLALAHTRTFREKLQAGLGSPFDERLYNNLQ
jgi:hypothetical protein